jgi:hypothetical protein
MATSANGFIAFTTARTTGPLPRLRKWRIPGADRHLILRDGSVGFLLIHFALWWHEKVNDLSRPGTVWDEWGWAFRPIRGQTSGLSNHASGTAMDLDATAHPLGVPISRTFQAWQTAKIRARIRFYRGILRWGGEWSRPDGMHIEIAPGVGLARCEKRARQLMGTPRGKRILAANPGAEKAIRA